MKRNTENAVNNATLSDTVILKQAQRRVICLKDADEDAVDDFHHDQLRSDAQSKIWIPVHCQQSLHISRWHRLE